MPTDATLDDIALGDVTSAQARAALAEALRDGDDGTMQRAYAAMRAWVWKALDARRRDPELREWFDVLKRVAALLRTRDAALAERFATLHELVHESIAVSERLPAADVLKRLHVRDVLRLLATEQGGRLDRAVIGHHLGLKQSNLTRILNMVTAAGLAERVEHGKHAEFQLTRAGMAAAARLGLSRPAIDAAAAQPRVHRHAGILPGALVVDAPTPGAGLRAIERQRMTLTGYSKGSASVRVLEQAARKNLYGKGGVSIPPETASPGIIVQAHLGNALNAGGLDLEASKAWADALYD